MKSKIIITFNLRDKSLNEKKTPCSGTKNMDIYCVLKKELH